MPTWLYFPHCPLVAKLYLDDQCFPAWSLAAARLKGPARPPKLFNLQERACCGLWPRGDFSVIPPLRHLHCCDAGRCIPDRSDFAAFLLQVFDEKVKDCREAGLHEVTKCPWGHPPPGREQRITVLNPFPSGIVASPWCGQSSHLHHDD